MHFAAILRGALLLTYAGHVAMAFVRPHWPVFSLGIATISLWRMIPGLFTPWGTHERWKPVFWVFFVGLFAAMLFAFTGDFDRDYGLDEIIRRMFVR